MKIIVNEFGQVERVEQSHLVANGSLQLNISVEIEGITQKQKEQMSIGYLSVIREDGFEIVDLLMERDASGANLVFLHKVQDSSQILAIPGNIQISAQIKALKEEYIGATQDELQNLENYYTFATVSVVGFVQKNIGSQREVGYAEKIIANNVRPIAYSVSTLQNDFADLQDEFEQVKEEFKDVQQGSVDDALSTTSTRPVQNKVVTAALNALKLQAGDGIIINGNVISATGASGGGTPITIDGSLSETSTNPVQNRAIAAALNQKQGNLTAKDGIILGEDGNIKANGVFRGEYDLKKTYEVNDIFYWQGGSVPAGYRYAIRQILGEDDLPNGQILDVNYEIQYSTLPFGASGKAESNNFYIDVAQYQNNASGLNDAIQIAYNNKPSGASRANIYFYESVGNLDYYFPANESTFISNCNYYFLDISVPIGKEIYLKNVENIDFYGVSLDVMSANVPLYFENCQNIQFFNCKIYNLLGNTSEVKNSNRIYFDNCEFQAGNYESYTFMDVYNTGTSSAIVKFSNCLFKQPSTVNPCVLKALRNTNTNAIVLLADCILLDGEFVGGENISNSSATPAKIMLSPIESREKYIDLSDFVIDGEIWYASINSRIKKLSEQGKGGQDRVDIYFYQSNPDHVFDFENGVVFRSNCNYYFLGAENLGDVSIETSGLYITQVSNCRFTGFKVSIASPAGAALRIENSSNIEFYDCVFNNIYSRGLIAYNSRAIYFNDCVISAGNINGQDICCYIGDNQTAVGAYTAPSWIIFENCYLHQSTVDASTPLVDCSSVSNTNSLVSILHCVTNGMEDVTASNVSKGSGKIRISQLTTV